MADSNYESMKERMKERKKRNCKKSNIDFKRIWFKHILFITRHDKRIGQSKKLCLALSMLKRISRSITKSKEKSL